MNSLILFNKFLRSSIRSPGTRILSKEWAILSNQNRFESSTSWGPHTKYDTWTYQHDAEIHRRKLFPKPERWDKYNEIVHNPDDGPVERYYCHFRDNIKYSPKKMYFVAAFIRGMSIDEAINQLSYVKLKGASIVKEVLQEAQDIAVKDHNFEFKSKMWIAESFCSKGLVMKGYRKHARMRFGEIRYFHCHYFVKLVEGDPPENYLPSQPPYPQLMSVQERLDQHIEKLRQRRIDFAL